MMGLDPATFVAVAGNLLYLALGVAVLAASPRSPSNRAFATFAIPSGLAGAWGRAALPAGVAAGVEDAVAASLYLAAAVGVVALARTFPTRLRPKDRRAVLFALVLGILLAGLFALWWARMVAFSFAWSTLGLGMLMSASTASTALFVARALRTPDDASSYAGVTVAVMLPTALMAGALLVPGVEDFPPIIVFGVLCVGVAPIGWLWILSHHRAGRIPLAVAWLTLATALLAQVATPNNATSLTAWETTVGLVRIVGVTILGLMILRGQVPGLETKVRWTVSRGTIAAAFITTFFLASEGAQLLFGQGNEWLGLLAAGALVFALAPLQRAAERLAERAVPVPAGRDAVGVRAGPRVEDVYRAVLRRYLGNGRLSREEERALAVLAAELDLDAARAFELREEIEREAQDGREAAREVAEGVDRA